jgi:hypothetical protein
MWMLVHPGLWQLKKRRRIKGKKFNLRLDYQNQYKHLMDEVHPIS